MTKRDPVKFYAETKNFNSESFNEDLQKILSITQINTCKLFEDTFLSVLNMHTPLKKKLLRANRSQYVTKALRKPIMRRSKLEKIYFKKQTNESLKARSINTRSRKILAANFTKKKEKHSSTISIHPLYPIIRLFGK